MSQPPPLSPDPSNPNPDGRLSDDDLLTMGVHPDARGFLEGLMVVAVGFMMVGSWLWHGGGRLVSAFVAWNRADRRNLGITALSAALLVVGFIAFHGHGSKVSSPKPPVAVAPHQSGTYTTVDGDNWESVAADHGITADALRAANPKVVDSNTAWCLARVIDGAPISKEYLAGYLPDGKTARRTSFCQLFGANGEKLTVKTLKGGKALETLKPKQELVIPTVSSDPGPALVDTISH